MTVTISEYIEIYDNAIHKTTTYKFVKIVNNTQFLYENVKTGCKQCFSIYDLVSVRNERLSTSKYERRKEIYKE